MRILVRTIGTLFVCLQMCLILAQADPLNAPNETDWLKTMSFAAHQTSYSGIFVYQSGGRIEISRITHVVDKDGEHERLEGLEGGRREVIRNNDQVWLYLGERKMHMEKHQMRRAFPALLPEQISALNENYVVKQAEEDRVAEFHAHTIVFQPKDNLRYTRKMWAHNESGLLLKAVVLDERGRVIEQYAFTQLNIGGNIDQKWIVADKTAPAMAQRLHLSSLPKVEDIAGTSGWQVDALPTGFKKILEMQRPLREGKGPVIHLVFSDGLAGISVFIEKAGDVNNLHMGLSGRGAVQVYNRVVGEHLVTVVGEVPPRTVIQVADSVRYAGQ